MLGADDGHVRRWARGGSPIPQEIADWLDKLAQFHEANLPPAAVWMERLRDDYES